jgi:hypothetical protein
MQTTPACADRSEPFFVMAEAAEILGVPYWKLQRAVKKGLVPSYRLLNSRPLVRLSEIVTAVERSRTGGA